MSTPEHGRAAQRRRTRRAIVDAAAGLLADGVTPTMAEVADAADVSRRTVYLYFPTIEHLLIDATVGALSQGSVADVLAAPELADDVGARVEAVARSLQTMSPDVERLGRSLIRLTVETPPDRADTDAPRRGYRRIQWIESALDPVRDRLDPTAFERLVAAIAMVVGWEALIVQRDICGLTTTQAADLSAWTARALVRAALDEAAP